jgi:SET domain-containing protein
MRPLRGLQVKRSRPGCGLGLFTSVPIRKGECVIEYVGKLIPTKLADTLTTKYLFEIDEKLTIDGSVRTNTARYINHSCRPNCEAELDGNRIFIYATKNIAAGEELTYDYGDEYFNDFIKPKGCRCDYCASPTSTR